MAIKLIKENPPTGKKRRKNKIKNPTEPKDRKAIDCFSGRSKANTLEPSRGGIGRRLKIASKRLRATTLESRR